MWDNARTQENLAALLADPRFRSVGPEVGLLADGDVGAGRLAALDALVDAVAALQAAAPLAGKRVLVTAGPTREALDPVRFLSNPSTGKMGLAMAHQARALGAQVTVVLGPIAPLPREGLEVIDVVTAEEMAREVLSRVAAVDVLVAAAAVSDWRPQTVSKEKAPKSDGPQTVTLVRTPDVLLSASQAVHALAKRPLLVGFAAQTHDVLTYTEQKRVAKRLDFIVANDVSKEGAGFGSDSNQVTVLGAGGARTEAAGTKREVAAQIWAVLQAHLAATGGAT
jgi:phosphopantothenoylcysteine decarboxylase/phosphopantothenate--cysteine ligase